MDAMKPVTEESVECYLSEDLPHAFLEKESDVLSIDMDLSDKKLDMGYDPILPGLQSEKLLAACEKDDIFILPEFQLDNFDDMIVSGEIMSTTNAQSSLDVAHIDPKDLIIRFQEDEYQNEQVTDGNIIQEEYLVEEDHDQLYDDQEFCDKSTQVFAHDLHVDSENLVNDDNNESLYDTEVNNFKEVRKEYVNIKDNAHYILEIADETKSGGVSQQFIVKSKFQPSIIKKRVNFIENYCPDKDGMMSVVAITTDNITQIIVNARKEGQNFKNKNSDHVKSLGKYKKLPKIKSAASDGIVEINSETSSTSHDLAISKALEEVGITDEALQPIITSDNIKVWQCSRDDCTRQFNKLCALKAHLLTHYGVRPFKCDYEGCSWAFYSDYKLKRHKETHLKRKDYVCSMPGCKRRFTTIYNLASHEKLHTRPNRVVCQVPDCLAKFQTKRALELHMKCHDQSHAPYVCNYEGCGKRYYGSNALTSHQRCHSYKEVDIRCAWPGCGKMFDQPCRLKAHMRIHTGCKPYACTFKGCKWAFTSSSKLKRHQKKHTNDRKFVCDVSSCGKAFMRSEHLREHRLTHTDERFFQCHVCASAFSAKSSLYVHIKKHAAKDFVSKGIHDSPKNKSNTAKKKTVEKKNVSKKKNAKKKDSPSSKSSSSVRLKKSWSQDFDDMQECEPVQLYDPFGEPITATTIDSEENIDCIFNSKALTVTDNDVKNIHSCPIDSCSKWYSNEENLQMHIENDHISSNTHHSYLSSSSSTSPDPNEDYVLYASPTSEVPMKQKVAVTPFEIEVFCDLPETQEEVGRKNEQPSSDLSNPSDSNSHLATEESIEIKMNQGSARTELTCSDVWKLKLDQNDKDSSAVATDVVLGTTDFGDSLFLTEDLPSMYCQEDMGGTEYQVLLLDTGPDDSAISMCDLE